MTSLALQLKQLAVRDTQLNVNDDIRRPSILFNPKEAASLDKEAVFAIGELCCYSKYVVSFDDYILFYL